MFQKFILRLHSTKALKRDKINQFMAEWIELWDLEAMTSYSREIVVRGPVGTSRLEFFYPGVHTHGFSPLDKPKVS